MGESKDTLIKWEKIDDFGIIAINNAPQNYIESPVFIDPDKLKAFTDNNSLKALIIKGHGRHFSAGANVNTIAEKSENDRMESELQKGREILDYISGMQIPTVALITGVCFGAGLEIALACHIRIASENATLGFPEVDRGLMPGFTGTFRLPRKIGKSKSLEIILSGDYLTAESAYEAGIIDHVTKKTEIMDFTVSLLKKMTDNRSLKAIRFITQSINNAFLLSPEKAMEEEAKMFCLLAKEMDKENIT